MATGHKKAAWLYLHCDTLGEMIYRKWKEKFKEKTLKGILIFKYTKIKNKKYT